MRWGGPREEDKDFHLVQYGPELFDLLAVNDRRTTEQLREVCRLFDAAALDQGAILSLPLPKAAPDEHRAIIAEHRKANHPAAIRQILEQLDSIVGTAMGFTADEVKWMRRDLETDELFKRMTPRHPYQEKEIRGLLAELAHSDRYEG